MPASLIDAESLLAVDVGTLTTQATLFDVVEGVYRFVAEARSLSTANAPFRDIREGVYQAIQSLETITGRTLIGADRQLIIPMQEATGVGMFAATLSAGPAVRTALVGLLEDVSMESLQRLARTTCTRVVESIGLNDARKPEAQLDSLLKSSPELVLMAGGTDSGATRSVEKLLEVVGLACYLLPPDKRPAVLFAGNQKMAGEVKSSLQPLASALTVCPNIRPDLETQDLQPARHALTDLYTRIRASQMGGVEDLNRWAAGTLLPTATAQGRIIRFLSEVYGNRKGILGVDIGASNTTIAAGFGGELCLGVYPQFGLGEGTPGILRFTSLEDILRWIPFDIPAEGVREYLYQKALFPATLPAVVEELAIEQALTRQAIHLSMKTAAGEFPASAARPNPAMLPYFEPILAGGSALTHAPTHGQSLLMLLDAIQPVGITTIILDQNNLLSALGAAASRSSILPVQVLESGAFLGLATVVTPVCGVKAGTPVLRMWLTSPDGNQTEIEVKQGALEILPLPSGQSGRLHFEPQHNADVGFGPGRAGDLTVSGTALGIVIDARGRPLILPSDPARRRDLLKKWLWTVGG